ncbi:rod shape-determining protein MreD [Gracilibacillus halotolerans]|uniref:Rod shape-determining protein MreD n=1 Tax=Gracilibacillus halotolerans TaxID=74386 RepID=A0A841RJA1_9BACI|nr:rod shape-determining protein MreD [Gracilibacillus halotolerans]MBB6511947.1 rod shape-determining protein MreD [Gracilibacillus halotolerans]
MKSIVPYKIALLCFIMVLLEGIATVLTLPFTNDKDVVLHFLFVFLVLLVVFFEKSHTYYAILFSLIFSIMIDILFTSVLGVYLFSYTITLYAIRIIMKVFHSNFFVAMFMVVIGVALMDHIVYLLNKIILIHDIAWNDYIVDRFIPTIIWSVIIGIIFYLIFGKRLERWSDKKFGENK